ncbi:MAG: ATP-binding protein, partial [Planctomycetaceae bacterium]
MTTQLSSNNVVGRDPLIARLWTLLQHNSLRLSAERRVGKTTVMLKMLDQPAPSFHPLFVDLEKIASPAHFVTTPMIAKSYSCSTNSRTCCSDLPPQAP